MGTVSTNFLPNSTGLDLGSTSQRWDAFIRDINISGTIGAITVPSINGIEFANQFPGADPGAQINAAFAALPATGGTVILTASATTYAATTQITVPANCQLLLEALTLTVSAPILVNNNGSIQGTGNGTVLKAVGIGGASSSVITNAGNSALNEGTATANSGLHFHNFKVDCNAAGNSVTTLNGMWIANCTSTYMENIFVTDGRGASACNFRSFGGSNNTLFRCIANASANIGFNFSLGSQWTISHCQATSNVGNGFDCGIGSSQGRIVECEAKSNGAAGFNPDTSGDIEVTGGNFEANTQYGIAITNAQHRISVVGARIYGNTLSGLYINNTADTVTVGNCIVSANGQHGIFINATGLCIIEGNIVTDNSASAANTYDGIRLQSSGGNTLRNIITGNIVKNLVATGQKYGVNEDTTGGGTIGQNIISLNNLFENQTSATNNLQSTDQVFGNRTDFGGTIASSSPVSLTSAALSSLVTNYNGIATVGNGVPAEYAVVDLTAQTATIGTTTLYTTPTAGQYRLCWNAKITTAATTGAVTSTLGPLTIVYTDPDSVAVTLTAAAQIAAGTIATSSTANTTGTVLVGVPMLLNCKAATVISYAVTYASNTAAQMAFNLHIVLERM